MARRLCWALPLGDLGQRGSRGEASPPQRARDLPRHALHEAEEHGGRVTALAQRAATQALARDAKTCQERANFCRTVKFVSWLRTSALGFLD